MSTSGLAASEITGFADSVGSIERVIDQEFFGTAFTIVVAQAFGFEDGNAGHVITFPEGACKAGDVILLIPSSDTFVSTPVGYTPLAFDANHLAAYGLGLVCTGGESSVTITTAGNFPTIVTLFRITGVDPVTPFDTGAIATANSIVSNNVTPAYTPAALSKSGAAVIVAACLSGAQFAVQTTPTWSPGFGNIVDKEFVSATLDTSHTQHQFVAVNLNSTGNPVPSCTWVNPTNNQTVIYVALNPKPVATGTTTNLTPDPLTGASTLTVTARRVRQAAAVFTAGGTLTSSTRRVRMCPAVFTATAALTEQFTAARGVGVPMAAASTLNATPTRGRLVTAAFAGATNISTTSTRVRPTAVGFAAMSTLTVQPIRSSAMAATLDGRSALTAGLGRMRPAGATFDGLATIAVSAGRGRTISVQLGGSGGLSVATGRAGDIALVLAAAADLEAATTLVRNATVGFSAVTVLTFRLAAAGPPALRTSRLSAGSSGPRLAAGSSRSKVSASSGGARLNVGT